MEKKYVKQSSKRLYLSSKQPAHEKIFILHCDAFAI
jgi:hypothetical protein